MMLAQKNMDPKIKIQVAVAVYAIMRTVHTARMSHQKVDAARLMKLYMSQGLQGSRAKTILRRAHS